MSEGHADDAAAVAPDEPCTAETPWRPHRHRLTPLAAVILFFGLFVGVVAYFGHTAVGVTLAPVPEFGLFVLLMGALAGSAGASMLYVLIWLKALTNTAATLSWRSWARLSLAVLGVGLLIFGLLVFGSFLTPHDATPVMGVDAELTSATRPVTFSIAALESAGLVGLLGLRQVAAADASWQRQPRGNMLLLIRLRTDLRRLLALLGAALTLLVIATGMRRRALLAYDPTLPIPKEQVLLYGLIFAAVLGLLFVSATGAIDARAATIVEGLEPFPDPKSATFATQIARRSDLGSAMGSASTFASFQSTVVIAAPLLSALIGVSTGS